MGRGERGRGAANPPQNQLRCRAILTRLRFMSDDKQYRTWMCLICGFVYDEAAGLPDEGIAPGTRWEDVPMNWTCPECGARKEDFELVGI